MRKILISVLTIVGALLLLYPVVAVFAGNIHIGDISRQQAQEMKKLETQPEKAQQLLEQAKEYNARIRGIPILDPYLYQMTKTGSEEYQEYLATLPGDIMARLVVPTAKIDLPVRHGTEDNAIARGAGHLFGTGLPVGGKGVNAVLTAHSGMRTASLFDGLTDVQVGDIAYVQVAGQKLAYKVKEIHIIKPTQLELFEAQAGRDLLTLFTCTPYGINTHRLVVTAERIALNQAPPMNESGPTWWDALRWWMIIPIIICAIGGTIVVRYLRKNRKDKDAGEGDSGGAEGSGGSGDSGSAGAGSGSSDAGSSGGAAGDAGSGSGSGSGGSPETPDLPGSPGSGVNGQDYASSGSASQNKEAPITSIKSDNSAGAKASETIGNADEIGIATGEAIHEIGNETGEAIHENSNPEINAPLAVSAASRAETDTKTPRLSRVERAKKLRDSKKSSREYQLSPAYETDKNPQRPEHHAPSHRKEKTLTK